MFCGIDSGDYFDGLNVNAVESARMIYKKEVSVRQKYVIPFFFYDCNLEVSIVRFSAAWSVSVQVHFKIMYIG